MKYETIMNNITAKLTGDPNQDIPYLMQQAEKYKDHTHGQELLSSIGAMIYEMLPEDQKQAWDEMINQDQQGIGAVMQEVQFQIFQKDYQAALELLEGLVAKVEESDQYTDNEAQAYFSFNNFLEDMLYWELYHPERDIQHVHDDYSEMYFIYGNLLLDLERIDEAEAALLNAARWNPMRADTLYALGEVYKRRKQWQEFYEVTVKALERAYQTENLTRGYRNLGYYYIEKEDFELATALFFLSLGFEPDNQAARAELAYIAQVTEGNIIAPTLERLTELFEQNHIQMGPNPLVVQIALSIGNEASQEGALDAAVYFYSIAYELTGEEKIKEQIDALAGSGLV